MAKIDNAADILDYDIVCFSALVYAHQRLWRRLPIFRDAGKGGAQGASPPCPLVMGAGGAKVPLE